MLVMCGCGTIQNKIDYTHMINPKHLPIEFRDETGVKHPIDKGNYVEVKNQVGDFWEIEILINGVKKRGLIPRSSKNGNSTLVYLEEFDNEINKGRSFCSEIQLKPQQVLTLRKKPLTNIELEEMLKGRSSEKSRIVNKETAIMGIQHGVDFELIDDDFGAWQKIRIKSKNVEFVGFISKEVSGNPTRKNKCK